MNLFKKTTSLIVAAAIVASTFVSAIAAPVTTIAAPTKAPMYTVQMINQTLTLFKDGKAFVPYQLSRAVGKDGVKILQTKEGNVRLLFTDSSNALRLIDIGKENNLEIKGTFSSLNIDSSVKAVSVTVAAYDKTVKDAVPTIIKDLKVAGAVELNISKGSSIEKASITNKDTKIDIAKGSEVKNVTASDGVTIGGDGKKDVVTSDPPTTDGGSGGGDGGGDGGGNPPIVAVDKVPLIGATNLALSNLNGNIEISNSAGNVFIGVKWVTQAEYSAYADAIGVAKAVIENTSATQAQVDTAIVNLETATTTFNTAKKDGEKVLTTPSTIVSFTQVKDVTVPLEYNGDVKSLLPASIDVTLEDGSNRNISVKNWTITGYDANVAGTYEATATFNELPLNVLDTNNVLATFKVKVIVSTAVNPPEPTTYAINIVYTTTSGAAVSTSGAIKATTTPASPVAEGTTVTINITGFVDAEMVKPIVTIADENDNSVVCTEVSDIQYTFTMPAKAVTITIERADK